MRDLIATTSHRKVATVAGRTPTPQPSIQELSERLAAASLHVQAAQRELKNALELQSKAARQLTDALQYSLPADQDSLPADLLTHILSFMEAQPLGRIESVCYRWRLAARDALQVRAQRLGKAMPILGSGESPALALRAIELLHSLQQKTVCCSSTTANGAHTFMVSFEGQVWSWLNWNTPTEDLVENAIALLGHGMHDNDLLVMTVDHTTVPPQGDVAAMIAKLAAEYGVDPSLISLEATSITDRRRLATIPRLVDGLTGGLAVKELVLCSTFGAILTVEGKLWMWAPDCGTTVPRLLPLPIRMASIVPGYALSEHGVLFSFSQATGRSFLQTDAHSVLGEPIVQVSSCPFMFAEGEDFSPLLLTASGTAVYTDLGPASGRRERVVSLSFVHAAGPVQQVLRSDRNVHAWPTQVNTWRRTTLDFILCGGCVFSIDIDFVLKPIPLEDETVQHICDGRMMCFALCTSGTIYRIKSEARAAKLINKATSYAEKIPRAEVSHGKNPNAPHEAELCDGALRWSLRNPAPSVVCNRAPRPPEHVVAKPEALRVFGLPDDVVELSDSPCGGCLARTANGVNYYCELEAMIMTNNNGGGLFDTTKGLMAVRLIRLECNQGRITFEEEEVLVEDHGQVEVVEDSDDSDSDD